MNRGCFSFMLAELPWKTSVYAALWCDVRIVADHEPLGLSWKVDP